MTLKHDTYSGFELLDLTFEIDTGAAAVLGGIGRQLDAINREHLPPDQAEAITEPEDTGEDFFYIVSPIAG
jgi:hypothetical protein